MAATAWWNDFQYSGGAMRVKATGARVPVEPVLAASCLRWLAFHLAVEAERRAVDADGPAVWFAPQRPRPWYLVWPVMALAGLRFARRPEDADLAFHFQDATLCDPVDLPAINGACLDISKSRVAAVFEQVSGRALALDPETAAAPFVEKGETNAAHDGVIHFAPCPPAPGRVHQRLIDTAQPDGMVEDWRCCMVGGRIGAVLLKRRPAASRFSNTNHEIRIVDTPDAFSAEEAAMIERFAGAMGLEWGGIDVLRERATGLIWIVDANRTDLGPPAALSLKAKMTLARILAAPMRAWAEALAAR
jgi:hypothetical protein